MRYWRGVAGALVVAAVAAGHSPATAPAQERKPLCLGAQALDPAEPCRAGGRRITRNLFAGGGDHPCRPVSGPPAACRFGVAPSRARRTVALVGDSHAGHWLAAMDEAAKQRRWTGISVTQPGCFFSEAVRQLPEGPREPCTSLYESIRRYLRSHPKISTVVVSSSLLQAVEVPAGQTLDAVKLAGFKAAYSALPASVKHLVVIRDPPLNSPEQFACVRRALQGRRNPNDACPLPRATALGIDPAVTAVTELAAQRYRAVDLSDLFCVGERCTSAAGGVQVYKDAYGHLTDRWSESLGTYLRRAIERAVGWTS